MQPGSSQLSHTHKPRAFTLLELIVVLAVLALVAAIAIPTHSRLVVRTELTTAEQSLGNISRRAFADAKLANSDITADVVSGAAETVTLRAAAPGLAAQGTWTVDFDPNGHSEVFGAAHGAVSDDNSTLGLAVHGPTVGCAYSSFSGGGGRTWSDSGVPPEDCNGIVALLGEPSGDTDPATPGFSLTAHSGNSTITLSWDSQGGATAYEVRCRTANLEAAGDTPKVVVAAPGGAQSATVNGAENFVPHTCGVTAVTSAGGVESNLAEAVPFIGPPMVSPQEGYGPSSLPPEGPEPAAPAGSLPTPTSCNAASPDPRCVTRGSQLAGLTSFASAHGGSHNLYTVDRSANAVRVITDSGSRASSTHLVTVVGADGERVNLGDVVDLVAGRHPSRQHPHGASPYSVLYAATSGGTVWLISPISGSSTWRAYQVATGIGSTSSLVYDNCPTAPGAAERAANRDCLHVATAAGVVVVPLTSTPAVAVEASWPARGPAAATAIASNTSDGAAGAGNGSWWTTSGTNVNRHSWSGAAQPYSPAPSGAAITGAGGIAWMSGSFWVADTPGRRLFKYTPSGNSATRTVVAGAPANTAVMDGTGTTAGFANPTRIHWHGNTPNLYVLDNPCVRRVNTDTGAVTSLLCPSELAPNPLWRADSPPEATVYSPSGTASSTSLGPAMRLASGGGYAVFVTPQVGLHPADTTSDLDLYRRNLATGEIELITDGVGATPGVIDGAFAVSADGNVVVYKSGPLLYRQVVGAAAVPFADEPTGSVPNVEDVSADGNRVLFTAKGQFGNVTGTHANTSYTYMWDATSDTYTMVSRRADNSFANSSSGFGCSGGRFSPTGNRVSFTCSAPLAVGDINGNAADMFVKDLATGELFLANTDAAGKQSAAGVTSGGMVDDSTAVFTSTSADLVPGDTNNSNDVFLKNVDTGAITRIEAPGGAQLPSAADGRAQLGGKVSFVTTHGIDPADAAFNDLYLYDPAENTYRWLSMTNTGTGGGWLNGAGAISGADVTATHVGYLAHYSANGNRRYLAIREL